MSERPLAPRWTGRFADLDPAERKSLVDRADAARDVGVQTRVREILDQVARGGDAALRDLTRAIDGVELGPIAIPMEECARAAESLPADVRRALERARKNIDIAHRAFMPGVIEVETEPGVVVGRRPEPLDAVGVYAPGGRAAYPSSVLMGVVPARAAGVRRVLVASPPGKNGMPSPVVLAAAHIGGATDVIAVGGAQAIAAMAFGTASVSRVDRIIGPGNAYVAEAKRQIAGTVGIDSPAGPSEILVVADRHATPEAIVRELLAQAEHDPVASSVALVEGAELAARVLALLAQSKPERRDIVDAALASRGAVLYVDDVSEALAFIEEHAPEHLMLALRDPESALAHAKKCGTVFLGETASVAFGDYMTGANHVLPTAGFARSMSGLSSLDFVRFTTYQRVTPDAAARLAADVALLADVEGLPSHANAARSFAGPEKNAR